MTGAMLAAVLALGINTGWEKQSDGSLEYVIQIDSQTLELLKKGEPFSSDIPPEVRGIRSYRIEISNVPPRRDEIPAETPAVIPTSGQEPSPVLMNTIAKLPGDPTATPAAKEAEAGPAKTAEAKAEETLKTETAPPRPWLPLTLAVAGLLSSVGGNLYLGWLIWEMRGRFRRLLHRSNG